MDTTQVLARFQPLNEDEQFYKDYYLSGSTPNRRQQFLMGINLKYIRERHLIVPEIAPEQISYVMADDEYFDENDHRSVFISRHNRYTPAFVHKHEFFEIVYVLTGRCRQKIGLESHQFRIGDMCFIAPGVHHTMEVFDDESLVFNILLRRSTFRQMFTPLTIGDDLLSTFFSEGLYMANQIQYLIFHTNGNKDYRETMLRMCIEQIEEDPYTDQILVGTMTILSARMVREYKSTMESSFSHQSGAQPEGYQVLRYIEEHIEDVTLSEVAKHFGFSVSYCSRLIKSISGLGFNEWKRKIRLRQAEQLLLNTTLSVAEISEKIGYINTETFIRNFKKEFHSSPAQYRKESL